MRILHVSEVHWGGVVSLIREFVEEQVDKGHDVRVLAPSGFPDLESVRVTDWEFVRGKPQTVASAYRSLRRLVREFDPDVIHLHSFLAGFVGRLPGAVDGRPVVYQPHAWSFDLMEGRLFGTSLRSWERWASRRTGAMVTNCQAEIDEGREVGVLTPAVSIGVAVDPEHYTPVDEDGKQEYRRQCEARLPHMLVCVGRLARQKGQDMLVESWERSRPADTELVLVGPGDTAQLAELAPTQWGKTVRAVGEQKDVRPWLWASDVLVLSSRYETVAMVVAEAMASGRPVVATAVNGTEEVLSVGSMPAAGRVVPLGDMDNLLKEAGRILEDSSLADEMARAGRSRAVEQFSIDAVGDRLRGAYAQAIRRGRAAKTDSAGLNDR